MHKHEAVAPVEEKVSQDQPIEQKQEVVENKQSMMDKFEHALKLKKE